MAQLKFLDSTGLAALVTQIKNRTTSIYTIKGSAIYADTAYLATEDATANGITAAGLWQQVDGTYIQLGTVANPTAAGYVYNIINSFTTDSNFVEGTGSSPVPAGTNVVVTSDGKLDALATGASLVAGDGITISGNTISLTDTLEAVSTDEIDALFE